MSKGNRGRIITGEGEPPEQETEQEFPLPALNQYWIVWFNPETEKVERETLHAHTVEIHEDGMLVFKAFVKNTDPDSLAVGAPPVYGYYVGSFRNHIRFGQETPSSEKVH